MSRRGTRRAEPRVEINSEFRGIEQFIFEYVTNVSRSGAFIRCDDPLPVGTRVRLKFTVIADEIETVEGTGEVVRTVRTDEATRTQPAGMGVTFVDLTPASHALLARLTADAADDAGSAEDGRAMPTLPGRPGRGDEVRPVATAQPRPRKR